jgi:hypothetical protein
MGVDFYAYSYVRIEPVPARFRAERKSMTHDARREFEKELSALTRDEQALVLCLRGMSRDAEGRLIVPDEVILSEELRNKFYETIGSEDDFLHVEWETNTIWRSTADTKMATAGRSYSGYSDFFRGVRTFYGDKSEFYMPPSTDTAPENGLVSTERCIQCLRTLEAVRENYVSYAWFPDCGVPPREGGSDNRRDDSWFFREFYTAVELAANGSGVLRIS